MAKKSRRNFLLGTMGVLGVGAISAWIGKNSILRWILQKFDNEAYSLSSAPAIEESICVLTTSQTEGPFFISSPILQDIRGGRQGADMQLKLQVVRMPDCSPVEGAIVEIWHCDAEGNYSGYPEEISHDPWETMRFLASQDKDIRVPPVNEKRYLRGAQQTDAEGFVAFTSILPGWYEPRTPHIHFKVLLNQEDQLTSQFYFDEAFYAPIFREKAPYNQYGSSPYTVKNDVVIHEEASNMEGLRLNPRMNGQGILEASARIGIQKA